jgi:GNAT superfamily N-acetyltransferase
VPGDEIKARLCEDSCVFSIRESVLADAEGIARASVESWRTTYRGILPDQVLATLDLSARVTKRRTIISGGEGLHLVALDGDELVAFCDAGPARADAIGRGEIYAIYLLERVQRQGLGRELFSRARAWLATHSLSPVSVWVIDANVAARRFYEAMGGRPVSSKTIVLAGVMVTEVAYVFDDRQ